MKIAFATIGDPKDIRRGSGTPYYLSSELKRQGHTVHYVGPLDIHFPLPTRIFKFFSRLQNKRYRSYQDPFVGRKIGRLVENKLQDLEYDVLLTNDYVITGFTKIKKPVVLYTDAIFTFNYSANIHPWLANLSTIAVYFCQKITTNGLQRATRAIFAAQFALEEAKNYIPEHLEKLTVIPYGANIEDPGSTIAHRNFETIRSKKQLDLLFVGKDWKLKGGEIAVNTVKLLNEEGVDTVLHLVGVHLDIRLNYSFVKNYGLLHKDKPEDNAKLQKLFSFCDALIVPSKAEGYGLVFVEAAAYGLPSLAFHSMGMITSVKHGESGILFDVSENEASFAEQILSWFRNPDIYHQLSLGARRHYEQTANWNIAVSRLVKVLNAAVTEYAFTER